MIKSNYFILDWYCDWDFQGEWWRWLFLKLSMRWRQSHCLRIRFVTVIFFFFWSSSLVVVAHTFFLIWRSGCNRNLECGIIVFDSYLLTWMWFKTCNWILLIEEKKEEIGKIYRISDKCYFKLNLDRIHSHQTVQLGYTLLLYRKVVDLLGSYHVRWSIIHKTYIKQVGKSRIDILLITILIFE